MVCKYCNTSLVLAGADGETHEEDGATIVVSCYCSTYAEYTLRVIVYPETVKG